MKLKLILILTIITTISITQTFAKMQQVKISSFNIQFYGIGGIFSGEIGVEYRDRWIKKFFEENNELATSDVIVFQEIVDVNRFKELLATQFNCTSYKSSQPNHQHIVICYRPEFSFKKVNGDDNFIIEESALIKYRPAVYGTLINKDGDDLITVVAVHLKARDNSQDKRKKQVELITKHLEKKKITTPLIILGDFNNYYGDQEMISDNFSKLKLTHLKNYNQLTYNNSYFKAIIDHVWLDMENFKDNKLTVSGPCNNNDKKTHQLDNLSFYNKFVSDHCPITLTTTVTIN